MGGIPAPLNYEGFPKSVCTSINEVVCHGIPSSEVFLKEGDIVNVDVSTIYRGYFSDSSRMYCIGKISEEMEIYMYEEWFEKLASKVGIDTIRQTKNFIEITINKEITLW